MAVDGLGGLGGTPSASPRGLNALIEAYVAARSTREAAALRVKALQAIEDRATTDLFDAMERVNLRSAKHDTLGTFALNDLAWAKVTDEPTAREWAETAYPELLSVNRQRLSAIVREALREGDPLPPGVGFTTSRKISWRGGPKGDEPDGDE